MGTLDKALEPPAGLIWARICVTWHKRAETFPRKRFLAESVENGQKDCGNPVESMSHLSQVHLGQ